MDFMSKYTKDGDKEPDKIAISNDAYAIIEIINEIAAELGEFRKRLK